LGAAVRLGKMVSKNSGVYSTQNALLKKSQPKTAEIVSTVVHASRMSRHRAARSIAACIALAARLYILSDAG
jgi:hypothetical protein